MRKALSAPQTLGALIILALITFSAMAHAQSASDFTYTVTKGQAEIDAYTGTATMVNIPSQLNGAIVTSIAGGAFSGDLIKGITIPSTVTTIGDGAFSGCFKLTVIAVPDSVTSFGADVFLDCESLAGATLGKHITSIPAGTFYNCFKLRTVNFSDNITSIGQGAFTACSALASITIPAGVTDIGAQAFENCTRLTHVTIPAGTIESEAFESCSGLTTVTFGSGVSSIGEEAFEYCSALTAITIPDNVTSLGDNAFSYCMAAKSISIGNGITALGDSVFVDCRAAASVTLGNNLTSIGQGSLSGCVAMTSLTIPPGVTSIGAGAFGSTGLTTVTLPSAITTIASGLFSGSALTSLNISANVTSIGDQAFADCGNLKGLVIPNTVTSIGQALFYECSNLESVTLPNGITSIPQQTFFGCFGLTGVTIPDSVTTIGYNAFCSSGLNSVIIGQGVTEIGDNAFASTNLVTVTIPASVTSLSDEAFSSDTSLKAVFLMGNAPTIVNDGSLYPGNLDLDFSQGVEVYCQAGATGFSAPFWVDTNGYSHPATVLSNPTLPAITSANTAGATFGMAITPYHIQASGSPNAFSATDLPAGLSIDTSTGIISGTPSEAGVFLVVLGATNLSAGTGTATLTLTVAPATASVALSGLTGAYNGAVHAVTTKTTPAGLGVSITYAGSPTPPANVGSYAVVASVDVPNYVGGATGTLTITPVLPVVATGVATLGGAAVQLNGTVNPETSDTTFSFQYGPTTTYGNTTSPQDAGSGAGIVAISAVLSLPPHTKSLTYHYRIVATNAAGTAYGADKILTSPASPTFATAYFYVAASGAQLSFGVNPDGVATTVHFIYSTDPNFGTFQQTAPQNIGSGKVSVNVVAFLSGLQANMTYYYEVVTVSAAGTFTSSVQSFTTLGFDVSEVAATGTGTYATLGNAATDVNDGVAFRATLTGVATASNAAIFANENSAAFTLMAQTGSAAPGTGGATFATLGDPVYDDNEDVAFGGTLKVATGLVTTATANGLWASSGGTVNLLAREGMAAPVTTGTATFAAFSALGLSNNNGAVFAATITGVGITAANNAGVWEGSASNSLALMLRTGEQVQDTVTSANKTISSFKFLPTETYVNGQTRGFGPTSGDLVANTTYTDKSTGVVLVMQPLSSGAATAVVTSGDPAAGTGSATFASFGNAAINDSDHVAFEGAMTTGKGGVVAATAAGIWADDSGGALQMVAREGQTAPGTAAGGTFLAFSDPVDNSNDAVAFRATLSGATTATASGIWSGSTGALDLVAQLGGQAPGCATGVKFSAFTELALNDNGGTMFLATLTGTGVTSANNIGIFAQDNTGTLQLIVRTADTLNGKTVTVLTFLPAGTLVNGQARSFALSSGDLVYNATFSDKSQAIFDVVFP